MKVIVGDLLRLADGADYIVQQCNCLTVKAHGLSEAIFRIYPEADDYKRRRPIGRRNLAIETDRAVPGSISIHHNFIVNLFAQWRPGKIRAGYFSCYPGSDPPETSEQRQAWFQMCLDELALRLVGRRVTVAFPYGIGCGLAGGNWEVYRGMLEVFDKNNPEIDVLVVRLPA